MRLRRLNALLIAGLAAAALAAAGGTAPAQQIPGGLPRPGEPVPGTPATPAAGPPTALPSPSLPPAPLPEASGSPQPSGSSPLPGSSGSPVPGASGSALPPAGAPSPAAAIVKFTGELLDLRNGFVYFTTGDAYKANSALRIVDYDTGGPTALLPAPRIYARATIDPASSSIVELALTKRRLPTDAAYLQAYAQAHTYAISGSPTVVAPELLHGVRLTGRAVAVTFFVQVPPETPLTDSVFITTDASGWVPNAMKMDRIDALHYRLTRFYASGTKFAYRYTRGSWTSVEVGEDGLQDDPHTFFVPEVDTKRLDNVVYRWSDQNPTQPQVGPDAIPTPFNPNPFGGFPSTVRQGVPQPSPTPRP